MIPCDFHGYLESQEGRSSITTSKPSRSTIGYNICQRLSFHLAAHLLQSFSAATNAGGWGEDNGLWWFGRISTYPKKWNYDESWMHHGESMGKSCINYVSQTYQWQSTKPSRRSRNYLLLNRMLVNLCHLELMTRLIIFSCLMLVPAEVQSFSYHSPQRSYDCLMSTLWQTSNRFIDPKTVGNTTW